MKLEFCKDDGEFAENIILVCDDKLKVFDTHNYISKLENKLNISIKKILKLQKFEGKFNKKLHIITDNSEIKNILIVSLGKSSILNAAKFTEFGGCLEKHINEIGVTSATLYSLFGEETNNLKEMLYNIGMGLMLRSYRFDQYKSKKKDKNKQIEKVLMACSFAKIANQEFDKYRNIVEGVTLTKNLTSEPPNVLTPISFAAICKDLEVHGIEIEILDKKKMQDLGMNALLGVAQGSANEPRLVVMKWFNSKNKKDKPIAFIGKGVTFDSGGLSLKPAGSMMGMKCDMGGAAVVTGLLKLLALRKAKVNALGVIGLVENMPDGNAQRPDDIVTSMSGQTIEILNTDAEGRLVLADVLWYTQSKYKPQIMIDLATLTGAIIVSLGKEYAGMFSNSDKLADRLYQAGSYIGEKVWKLPLSKEYDKLIDSKIADMKNISDGGGAGSITAAQFLQRFVNDVPWIHLDIAGVTDSNKGSSLHATTATGFGVRLLNHFVEKYYE